MSDDLPQRVLRLEETTRALSVSVETIGGDVKDLGTGLGGLTAKVDKLVEALSSTDGRAAERAAAVKTEIREEGDRKARDRTELFKNGLSLFGFVALIVTAFGGPYLNKVNATADGLGDATKSVAQVREQLAQQGADIARNRDGNEIARERNRKQDDQIYDLGQRVSHIEGGATGR